MTDDSRLALLEQRVENLEKEIGDMKTNLATKTDIENAVLRMTAQMHQESNNTLKWTVGVYLVLWAPIVVALVAQFLA